MDGMGRGWGCEAECHRLAGGLYLSCGLFVLPADSVHEHEACMAKVRHSGSHPPMDCCTDGHALSINRARWAMQLGGFAAHIAAIENARM